MGLGGGGSESLMNEQTNIMVSGVFSEDESVSTLLLFLGNLLEVLVDNSDSEHDTGAGADGAHEVSEDAESSNAHSTEGGSRGDVAGEVSDHGLFTKAFDNHVLLHQLAHDIAGGRTGHINPYAREEGTGSHDKEAVEEPVEGISLQVKQVSGGRDVVSETANGGGVASHVVLLPFSEEAHENVSLELTVKHLGEEVEVGDEGGLEDNGDVRGVEELDGVGSLVATDTSGGQLELNTETLY